VTKDHWDLRVGYEPRLGSVFLAPVAPHASEPCAHFRLPISTILRDLKIPPAALGQMVRDAAAPPALTDAEPLEDVMRRAVPADCTGLTVLDVGGYDGRMAFLAEQRGAKRAICTDNDQWEHYGWTEPPQFGSVEYETLDFMAWDEPVDVVLFFNVLYHCQDPWAALAHLRTITRKEMLLSTLVIWDERPVWELFDAREVNPDDDTVYWGPSPSGLERLLRLTGWSEVTVVGKALERLVLRCRP